LSQSIYTTRADYACAKKYAETRENDMASNTRIKLTLAAAMLGYMPWAIASEKVSYPTEKVATFVVDNLDVTSLPSVFRTKKQEGKKTFADYGYTTQNLGDEKAVEGLSAEHLLSIRVLEESPSGIYACVAKVAQDESNPTAQNVILIKRKESSALLKGSESSKEFASCPRIPTLEAF
jgi:hypothetical protein